jgi:8-oxo-dGTP diphosphatase
MADYTPFEVVITAIIQDCDKYLVTRRSPTKKRFPGMWTVPGGHLEPADFMSYPKDTEFYWYNVLEKALARETEEEVGIKIKNVKYLTSLATEHKDGAASIVISCYADYISGDVKLQMEENDKYDWVTTEEARNIPLIDGILDEFIMIDKLRAGEKVEWQRY